MSDSLLRRKKVFVVCPDCKGHKGVYGKSAMGYPATLPCPTCDAIGEVDQFTLPLIVLTTVTEIHKGTPLPICTCDLCDIEEDPCPVHPKGDK